MATHTYEKGGLTVFWDSTRCIHTGICLRSLHSVFNVKNRPWVNLDGGDVEAIAPPSTGIIAAGGVPEETVGRPCRMNASPS